MAINGNGNERSREEQFRQGLRLLHQGRAVEAGALLEPLHEQDPGNVEVALNLGGAYILQQRYEDAVEILEPAVK
ncbi:MAG: tetratricopeptide repeat protein, partial [Chloroflexota bacterium]|nr:tetratricopeptide repeat protein [Chloroflexota bacterium]